MAKPKIKMASEPYEAPDFPAPLQWWDVFRGSSKAGELLASFELLQVTISGWHFLLPNIALGTSLDNFGKNHYNALSNCWMDKILNPVL